MKKVTYLLTFAFLLCCMGFQMQAQGQGQGQKVKTGFDKSRLFTGGNIGLSFSNNYSFIEVSPIIGYYFTEKLSGGLGPSYQFHRFGFLDLNFNIIGARAFVRYDILDNIFLHGEYGTFSYKDNSEGVRRNFSMLPIGGGYRQWMGRTSIYAMALYDFMYAQNRDNANLLWLVGGNGIRTNDGWLFRVGINFGL